jgi:hypothetical protein
LIENVFYTRLAAALAFPCSLFLKSQPPELAPVEDSVVGAVMSLSCKDNENACIVRLPNTQKFIRSH